MPRGKPSPKLAITIDADVHRLLLRAAEAEEMSVSAWVTDAVRRELQIRDGLAAVAEFEAEHGTFTEEERDAARARIAEELRR